MVLGRLYNHCIGLEKSDDARHSLFEKAKHELDVLPLTHGALELHITMGELSS